MHAHIQAYTHSTYIMHACIHIPCTSFTYPLDELVNAYNIMQELHPVKHGYRKTCAHSTRHRLILNVCVCVCACARARVFVGVFLEQARCQKGLHPVKHGNQNSRAMKGIICSHSSTALKVELPPTLTIYSDNSNNEINHARSEQAYSTWSATCCCTSHMQLERCVRCGHMRDA